MIGLGKQKKQVKENKAIISEGATRFTDQSARLFHWFFNVSSVCEDAAKLTAHYLRPRDKQAMGCVSKSCYRFFSQLSQENTSAKKDFKTKLKEKVSSTFKKQ